MGSDKPIIIYHFELDRLESGLGKLEQSDFSEYYRICRYLHADQYDYQYCMIIAVCFILSQPR